MRRIEIGPLHLRFENRAEIEIDPQTDGRKHVSLEIGNRTHLAGAVELGEPENALDALERMLSNRGSGLTSLAVNPLYNSLRGQTRFQKLAERVGLAR